MVFLSKFKAVREISPRRKAMQSHFCVWGYFENLLTKLPTGMRYRNHRARARTQFFDKYSIQQHNIHVDGFCSKRMERM